MPIADGMRTGSDHGPAGSSACTSSCPPSSDQLVVIIQNRPSWCRSVGAKIPPDGPAFETSSCDGRSSDVADLLPRAQVGRPEDRHARRVLEAAA